LDIGLKIAITIETMANVGQFQQNFLKGDRRQQSTVMKIKTKVAKALIIDSHYCFCGLLLSMAKRAIVMVSLMRDHRNFVVQIHS
jgi:hypothetical protein